MLWDAIYIYMCVLGGELDHCLGELCLEVVFSLLVAVKHLKGQATVGFEYS